MFGVAWGWLRDVTWKSKALSAGAIVFGGVAVGVTAPLGGVETSRAYNFNSGYKYAWGSEYQNAVYTYQTFDYGDWPCNQWTGVCSVYLWNIGQYANVINTSHSFMCWYQGYSYAYVGFIGENDLQTIDYWTTLTLVDGGISGFSDQLGNHDAEVKTVLGDNSNHCIEVWFTGGAHFLGVVVRNSTYSYLALWGNAW